MADEGSRIERAARNPRLIALLFARNLFGRTDALKEVNKAIIKPMQQLEHNIL